ncbi:MAG: 5'-methylthioadenosine/S-adenosylhomocysteine nucleosidase [Paraglaciecola sp.]|uniref:5'-methylthioadenosine/S-adenosylhomocysteine nucleosidase n=1 Tax=Paraglaciecola sp. TaxID=1920173 RepID=UPI00273F3541|nr:5'-methylthioadenosine/S-adenosylhomocysteine nucleosidase [Paraglaciecola sp.]MDP5033118.1 5'-methylthioadenosine/S-adenosylhomocysteine nucleosidase [Paraglaciecola sp.]MDP5130236.1 5'-methylthioadenosine/S-adenosylhomocysteine nucleosidase [Paraglaciecola sp.]
MKIAILGAMDEEISLLRASLTNVTERKIAHLTVYFGELNNTEVALVKCGIGKVAAAVSTTLLVMNFQPDYVINTGSAGGFSKERVIGDIVIATELRHYDADLTFFGYELGQCAGMPAKYECDTKLITCAQQAMQSLDHIGYELGLICSGDSFVGSDEGAEKIRQNFPSISAVEMEGVAIGQTCHLLNVPFLVIRSLSDIAGVTSTVSFQTYLETAGKHSAQIVMQTLALLAKQN